MNSQFKETMTIIDIKAEEKLKEYCCICGSVIYNHVCPVHGLEFKPVLTPKFKIDIRDEMGFIYKKIQFSFIELAKILPPSLKSKLALLIDQLRAAQVIVIKLNFKPNNKLLFEAKIKQILTNLFLNYAEYKMGAFVFQERELRSDGTKVCFAIIPEIREDKGAILITLMSKVFIVRNLWSYIRWRKKLGAEPEHIIQSLKSTRRFIKSIDGYEGEIREIYGSKTQKFSQVLVYLRNRTETIYKVAEVFHDETSGIAGIMAQFQINEALRTFSQQFLTFIRQIDLVKRFGEELGLKKIEETVSIYFEKPDFYLSRALEVYLKMLQRIFLSQISDDFGI
ncbi:MAG: hypothetical protein ACFFBD_27710, partial [Candidatus Hodarchaeota archaeon]